MNFGAKNEENLVDFGVKKSYRCPKFDGDTKQTLEIRVERKRNLKLDELGEVSFRMLNLGDIVELYNIQVG